MQTLHGKGSTDCENSDSNSRRYISRSGVDIVVHVNHILTKLCR